MRAVHSNRLTLRRFDPLKELLMLQERMNQIFDDARDRPEAVRGSAWEPVSDVFEDEAGFVIQMEVPGLSREDVTVTVEGDLVLVRGERRALDHKPESYHRTERRYGPFARSFRLPAPADGSAVTADLREGLLCIELPRLRRSAARRVRVERESPSGSHPLTRLERGRDPEGDS